MAEQRAQPVEPLAVGGGTRPTSCVGALVAFVSIGIGMVYLLVPTLGIFELIPDAIPYIGSLDEAGATGMVILGAQYLARRRREKLSLVRSTAFRRSSPAKPVPPEGGTTNRTA